MDVSSLARDLDNLENSWLSLDSCLNFWTIVVVVGVAVELLVLVIEYAHGWRDFKRGTIRSPDKPSLIAFSVAFLGAALVAVGVAGEFRIHVKAGKVESDMRNKTRRLVAIVQTEASEANTRAASAIERATDADARTLGEIDARLALEKRVLWEGPRDVLIRASKDRLSKAILRFRGQLFINSICWP